jgi:FMN phosphatase YigB (HAD superfamily)
MPKTASKRTIAVDVDDVLAAFAKGFTDYSNKKWGTHLVPDDYDEHWGVMWRIDEQEAVKRGEEIHANASGILMSLAHNPEAKGVLVELSKRHKLVIVTSRRRAVQKDTLEWVDRYFKGIFDEVHFAGIWDDDNRDLNLRLKATKAEIIKQIGADYLIDDQPKHCIAAAEAGIKALLFGDYRWTRGVKLRPNMTKVKNWQEVLEYFDATG